MGPWDGRSHFIAHEMWLAITHLHECDVVEQKEYLQSLVNCVQHWSSTKAKHPHLDPSVFIYFTVVLWSPWKSMLGKGDGEEKMKRAFDSIFQASVWRVRKSGVTLVLFPFSLKARSEEQCFQRFLWYSFRVRVTVSADGAWHIPFDTTSSA